MNMEQKRLTKWCSYCSRNGHSLAECWSTRPADWPNGYSASGPITMAVTAATKQNDWLADLMRKTAP